MFMRCLTDLVQQLKKRLHADAVEACQQMIWETRADYRDGKPQAFSLTRVRVQQNGRERQLTTDCWMPDAEILGDVAACLPDEEPAAPIPVGERSRSGNHGASTPAASREERDANWIGHRREILVNSHGCCRMWDGTFRLVRTGYGLRQELPFLQGEPDERRVLLDPLQVPPLISAGWLRSMTAVTSARPWFYRKWDGLGQSEGPWVRLPLSLVLVDRMLTLSGITTGTVGGVIAQRVEVGKDIMMIYTGEGRVARLPRKMVQSVVQVSDKVAVTDGHLPYLLPWVAVEGQWQWV